MAHFRVAGVRSPRTRSPMWNEMGSRTRLRDAAIAVMQPAERCVVGNQQQHRCVEPFHVVAPGTSTSAVRQNPARRQDVWRVCWVLGSLLKECGLHRPPDSLVCREFSFHVLSMAVPVLRLIWLSVYPNGFRRPQQLCGCRCRLITIFGRPSAQGVNCRSSRRMVCPLNPPSYGWAGG